ncbi:hypothetical protein OAT16_11705 [Prolixibacteraceae bacterium]|nr:hypothetical protein [Prolixibacteraceae bacterium]
MDKSNEVFDFFSNKFPFNQDGLNEFSNAFTTREYKKGSIIPFADNRVQYLQFLEEGIGREYFAMDDKEMNTSFM